MITDYPHLWRELFPENCFVPDLLALAVYFIEMPESTLVFALVLVYPF